ncbi:MAG: hypothetical protein ABSH06_10055 [Thermodesulfobacteriota bacterium]
MEKHEAQVELLEDYFHFRDHEDFKMNESMADGVAGILADVRSDLRLLVADMMAEVEKDVAEFQKRRAEEKKDQVNA